MSDNIKLVLNDKVREYLNLRLGKVESSSNKQYEILEFIKKDYFVNHVQYINSLIDEIKTIMKPMSTLKNIKKEVESRSLYHQSSEFSVKSQSKSARQKNVWTSNDTKSAGKSNFTIRVKKNEKLTSNMNSHKLNLSVCKLSKPSQISMKRTSRSKSEKSERKFNIISIPSDYHCLSETICYKLKKREKREPSVDLEPPNFITVIPARGITPLNISERVNIHTQTSIGFSSPKKVTKSVNPSKTAEKSYSSIKQEKSKLNVVNKDKLELKQIEPATSKIGAPGVKRSSVVTKTTRQPMNLKNSVKKDLHINSSMPKTTLNKNSLKLQNSVKSQSNFTSDGHKKIESKNSVREAIQSINSHSTKANDSHKGSKRSIIKIEEMYNNKKNSCKNSISISNPDLSIDQVNLQVETKKLSLTNKDISDLQSNLYKKQELCIENTVEYDKEREEKEFSLRLDIERREREAQEEMENENLKNNKDLEKKMDENSFNPQLAKVEEDIIDSLNKEEEQKRLLLMKKLEDDRIEKANIEEQQRLIHQKKLDEEKQIEKRNLEEKIRLNELKKLEDERIEKANRDEHQRLLELKKIEDEKANLEEQQRIFELKKIDEENKKIQDRELEKQKLEKQRELEEQQLKQQEEIEIKKLKDAELKDKAEKEQKEQEEKEELRRKEELENIRKKEEENRRIEQIESEKRKKAEEMEVKQKELKLLEESKKRELEEKTIREALEKEELKKREKEAEENRKKEEEIEKTRLLIKQQEELQANISKDSESHIQPLISEPDSITKTVANPIIEKTEEQSLSKDEANNTKQKADLITKEINELETTYGSYLNVT